MGRPRKPLRSSGLRGFESHSFRSGPPAMSTTPIADHALISDCRSVALVDRAGSVEWLCWPRMDAPSVFGRLLDPAAGHWSIAPVAPAAVDRRYHERTMVLETTFTTADGTISVTDALVTGAGE